MEHMGTKPAYVGDKFVIEIDGTYFSPVRGDRYFVRGIPNFVLTDKDIAKLERYEPKKEVLHTCENCLYRHYEREMPPCSTCDNNYDIETRDMFKEKR